MRLDTRKHSPVPPEFSSGVGGDGASHRRRALRHGVEFQAADGIDNARKTAARTTDKREGHASVSGYQNEADTGNSKRKHRYTHTRMVFGTGAISRQHFPRSLPRTSEELYFQAPYTALRAH